MTGTLARVGAITSWLVLILCALIDFTTTALLFWHWLGWLDRDLAGVVTDMAITEIPILSVLIGAVVVSIWLGFRGREF